MEDIYINFVGTFLIGTCSYFIYKNYIENPEPVEIEFAGEKLSDSEKKDICDSILNDINFNNTGLDHEETSGLDNDQDNEEHEEDNEEYEEDNEEHEEDNEYDHKTMLKKDEYCNFPKHPKLRKGYYRIRFENSDRENELNFVSINNMELFHKIENKVNQMILEDNGKNNNKTDTCINNLLKDIDMELSSNICSEKDKILY